MDWGICGQLYSQDGKKYMEDGVKCIDYVDYWPDVIEEDAVNEKYCKKVLRKLIKKADHELEEDLFILQTRLEWAEKNKHDEWFDTCYKGLKENIQKLELSICSLKDVGHGDIDDNHTKVLREPARRVHEVIKALLSKELQNKHEQMGQPADSIPEEVRSDQQPAGIFSEDLRSSELPADILSRDLGSDEQPSKIVTEDLRTDTLSHSSGLSDSTTAETEKAKSKFTSFTESSLCLKPNPDVSAAVNIQDFGDTVTSGTTSIISSLTVPGHMNENAIQPLKCHGQEPMISVIEKTLSLVPSLELLQRQEKNMASKSSFVLSNPSVNSKGEAALKPESIAQSNRSGTQKSGLTVTENRKRSTSYWNSKGTKKHMQNHVNGRCMPVSLRHNSTSDISSSNSSLMLQEQMDKQVMQFNTEPLTSVTYEPVPLLPSSAIQRKVRIKSEIHVVEEPKSITGVSVHRDSSLNSQRKISQSVESKAQLFPLGTEKSVAALTGSMTGSASSSKSRGTQKRKQDQVEGQKSYRRSLTSREKQKSRVIQKDGERVKMPMVASNEPLSLPEPTTYNDLNNLKLKQWQKHGMSLGLRGWKDYRKEALIHKILEAKKPDAQMCIGTSMSR
ncbi:hypothetical protein C5167_045763 [Papaver somniferum]|uniref:Uncharacterized protein n=1 Tax=Papaver somniferum TaxID=3469 RepID=A0A4Y7LBU5_PAPSO|nr:uncharacterized protein LOC113320915 [Papaver somniferum]XP_026424595.1 uncharacterized protein LOC113320915 [Papaver somniferum]XP_026424596.1 uncharacterized protein LOC113320915 [Papaver somniferum]RZC82974.1 hypothetical protein C5167_045763 [Papaver somniferum]